MEKLSKQLLSLVCGIPVSGITWIVPRQSLREWYCPETFLSFLFLNIVCVSLSKYTNYSDATLLLYLKRKDALALIVTLESDLRIAGVSSPTLHSAVVLLSVVSRLRAGSHVIGWLS